MTSYPQSAGSKKRTWHVSFNDSVDSLDVPAYSEHDASHPSTFLFNGPIGSSNVVDIQHGHDRYTGLTSQEMRVRRMELSLPGSRRTKLLEGYLADGAMWERPTPDIVAAMSKASRFKKARLGCKAAKRAELMLDTTGELSGAQATEYRALSARANFLSLDRPAIAYATKELCRCFAHPTDASVDALRRLVRYLIGKPRRVWKLYFQNPTDILTTSVDTDLPAEWLHAGQQQVVPQ